MSNSRWTGTWDGKPWRVFRRATSHPRSDIRERKAQAGVARVPGDERYQTLVFVVAASVEPMHASLRALSWGLVGVSVAVWGVAAIGSRWMCRRALIPLIKMSGAVKEISADDLGGRLPVPATRDELTDLAAAFNDLLARLQEAFERQRRFTGEASHQLRTPLTAMLGQMEVALRRERDPDEYRRALTSAVAQAGRLRGIVESLLFLARADADAELPDIEIIDLAACVRDYLEGHPHDRKGDIRLDAAPTIVSIKAQPAMLAQVVGNLIDNACKYSDPGTPITIAIAVDGGDAMLVIADAGHGIEPLELGRIFQPFFRSAEARRRGVGGLGLGLAVAARIVRSFGGRFEVWSELGRGSRFTVRLPLTADKASELSTVHR